VETEDSRRIGAVGAAAGRLRVDYAAAEAIRALDAAGVQSIVLKGPSVARWLYVPEDARLYVDCDLLVAPDKFEAAVGVLVRLGFEPELDETEMPTWWREHALTTFRKEDGVMIDLHRSLQGVHVPDEQLWATLSEATDTLTVGDFSARALTEPGRVMHVALHAAQHGGTQRDLDVLGRALDQLDEGTWRAAAELAAALDATAGLERGLRFLPAGARLADRLGLHGAPAIEVELRAEGAAEALTVARFLATRGLLARLALLRHKLAPPPTFMRKWSPLARRGRLGLAIAYLWRPIWIVTRTPRALQAWSRARGAQSHRSP